MNGIVKRRKTADYAQIHNEVLQQLEDIRTIGLISHLMSLPETWVVRKMQLYDKFGRGPITNGIAELEAKKYWVDIKYRDGKKNLHYYNVSDIPFDDLEVLEMISEVESAGFKIIALSASFTHLLSIGENQQFKDEEQLSEDSSIVDFEQLKMKCSNSSVENRHLLNKDLETNINKINKDKDTLLINKGITADNFKTVLTDSCNEFYSEFAVNRWSKQQWNVLIGAFVSETVREGRHENIPENNIRAYAYQAIKNMAYKFDLKNGRVRSKIPLYNWLEDKG